MRKSVESSRKSHVSHALIVLIGALIGCGRESSTAPSASQSATAQPTAVVQATPPVAPAEPPPAPTPADEASKALEARNFDAVCNYLEFEGFSRTVCDYLAARAKGERGSLPARDLERFLRGQQVGRRSGSIVGLYESGSATSYETRIAGRVAILEVVDTEFTTTGRFTLWAQRIEDETVTMASGDEASVPVYLEWPLVNQVLDVARARGDGGAERAVEVLGSLVESWPEFRHPSIDGRSPKDWGAFLASKSAANPAEGAR